VKGALALGIGVVMRQDPEGKGFWKKADLTHFRSSLPAKRVQAPLALRANNRRVLLSILWC
jgi:hypothetical protein